jgi:hypothetical protein
LIGGSAAAVIYTEIVLTRLFSVLLFYHYSFLAVAIALFGLAAGGLSAARENSPADDQALYRLLRNLLSRSGQALLALILVLVTASPTANPVIVAVCLALLSSVPLFLLGKVLALSLAAGRSRIHGLYAVDLLASSTAALTAIPMLSWVQGPLVLAVPALIALVLALALTDRSRRLPLAIGVTAVATVLALAVMDPGPLLSLRAESSAPQVMERWNSHSRVLVLENPKTRRLIIDKSASTVIPETTADSVGVPEIDPTWTRRFPDPAYALGRTTRRICIIGVGGGPDLLPALAAGATRIDGYELNGRVLEVLKSDLSGRPSITKRPEIHLVHDEARHALQRTDTQYDVLRANLVDTWAATAAGGFVLAENGLYTLEGWRLFLRRLTPSGVLVMTRWYLPGAPAEAQRLVVLAADALEAEGIRPARANMVALAMPTRLRDSLAVGPVRMITTLISRQPFSAAEVDSLEHFAAKGRGTLLLAPGRTPPAESRDWVKLTAQKTRGEAIAASQWAIDSPTDERPFFFLQLRPLDVLRLGPRQSGPVTTITLRGVQILALAALAALTAAFVLGWLVSRPRDTAEESLDWVGRCYFGLLGLGYMAVQLGLHQRLSIVLGHPTATLALVIASMLLGTGLGSALAGLLSRHLTPATLLAVPILALGCVCAGFSHVPQLAELPSRFATALGAGLLSCGVGVALGFALPTGMSVFARSQAGVTEAWTMNGAFSVVGSVLAAAMGLLVGSRGLLLWALPMYAFACLLVIAVQRRGSPLPVRDLPIPSPLVP